MATVGIPPAPGVYVLLLGVDRDALVTVRAGAAFAMPRSLYAYVGSARGPGGLAARLARHLRRDKRLHWHVDYLLERATPRGILCFGAALGECRLASLVAAVPGAVAVAGFGSSDCRCRAHLYALPPGGDIARLAADLRRLAAAAATSLPLLAVVPEESLRVGALPPRGSAADADTPRGPGAVPWAAAGPGCSSGRR